MEFNAGVNLTLAAEGKPWLFLPIFLPILAAGVVTVCVLLCVKLIKQQIKLHNSITLVELSANKFLYWVLTALTFVGFVFCVVRAAAPSTASPEFMMEVYGMGEGLIAVCYAILALMLLSVFFVFLVLSLSRCAVVDKGVYTVIQYIDWYHIYDYYFEEKNSTVMVTKNKAGLMSIEGVTPPLKCRPKDVEKLKFILNKNRNKFFGGKYTEN